MINHPEMCYSNNYKDDCIIIKWGEPGYYETDYPKGKYTDDVIDKLNANGGITPQQRRAMEICSMVAQDNPNLNWENHYNTVINML